MSASLNEVRLLGYLGTDPETKSVKAPRGDTTVTTFRLATNSEWTDATGQRQSRAEWHTVEVWGNQARAVGQYLTRGRQALVLGSLRYDLWEKDGQKHSRPKVVAGRVVFLGSPRADPPSETPDVAGDEPPGVPF